MKVELNRNFDLLMRLVAYAVNRLEPTHFFRAGTSNSGRKVLAEIRFQTPRTQKQ